VEVLEKQAISAENEVKQPRSGGPRRLGFDGRLRLHTSNW